MDSPADIPLTLNDAIATEPMWLQLWVMLLVITNLAALLFVVGRRDGRFHVRAEPIAILASFFAAAALMSWIHAEYGYVRLLGLAHLVFWGPVWVFILTRRTAIGTADWFGRYIHVYLAIAGASLVIDLIDVVRYLLGDGAL